MPCGPTMRRNQKTTRPPPRCGPAGEGAFVFSRFSLADRVSCSTCMVSRHQDNKTPPRPPMPREGASQRERPALSNKTEPCGVS